MISEFVHRGYPRDYLEAVDIVPNTMGNIDGATKVLEPAGRRSLARQAQDCHGRRCDLARRPAGSGPGWRSGRLQLTIPAGDTGWAWNPQKRRHRWHGYMNGLRAVILQGGVIAHGGGGVWSVTMKGKNVTGASAIGFSHSRYTLAAGGTCAAQ